MSPLRTIIGAAVASLAVAAPSSAAPFTPELERAYSTALRFWHVSAPPNCVSIDQEIVASAQMPEGAEGLATVPSEPEPCILWLTRKLAAPRLFERACAVEIHEVGHLLGYEHSDDPGNVMFPSIVAVPAICWRIGLREANRRAS